MAQQNWVTFAAGGSYAAPVLSKKMYEWAQYELQFDSFTERSDDIGSGQGDILWWGVDQDLTGAPTTFAGSVLNENNPIPLSPWTRVRTSVSMEEVGRGTSVSKRALTLSDVDIDAKSKRRLKNHLVRILDEGAHVAFTSTAVKYTPTGAAAGTWSLTGTAGAAATANLTAWHFRDMHEYMYGTLRIPPWDDDGNYIFVTRQEGIRSLYEDPDFEEVQNYARPEDRIKGEVGSYYHFRIVRTNDPNVLAMIGTANVCAESVAFGSEAVLKAVAAEPMILADSSGDFGRTLRLAWWGILNYGIIHQYTVTGDARVVHVSST